MSHLIILFRFYLFAIFLTIVFGVYHYKRFDKPLRIFFILMLLTFMNETTTYVLVLLEKRRTLLSHIFSFLELSLICMYFIYCLNIVHRKMYSLLCVVLSALLGYGNSCFFQSIDTYNTYMLIVEAFLIIGMALFMLYSFFKNDALINISRNIHFRIWIAVLILWTGTFFYWGLFQYFLDTKPSAFIYDLMTFQLLLNVFVYSFFAYTFFSIKKLTIVQNKR